MRCLLQRVFLPVFAALTYGLLAAPALPQELIALVPPSPLSPPAVDSWGHAIAFVAQVAADGTPLPMPDIWLWNSASNSARRLTNYAVGTNPSAVTDVTLSSDGATIACVVSTSGQGEQIHVIDTAAATDTLLTTDTKGCVIPDAICVGCSYSCVHDPHFTPDGRVLYAASRSQPFYTVSPAGTVVQLPIYSGQLARAAQRVVSDAGLMVFTSEQPGNNMVLAPIDVYLANLDGTAVRNVTSFPNESIYSRNAVISADGLTIVFESNYGAGGVATQGQQIFAINADGTNLRQLSAGSDNASDPSLSADGSTVAFTQSGAIKIVPANPVTGPIRQVGFLYSTARTPALTGDASQLVFGIGPSNGGTGAIYRAPAPGGAPSLVYAPLALNIGAVYGAAGSEPPSPGSIISLYGLNFSNDQFAEPLGFPLPTSLANASVLVNGQPVPIEAVTPWQINAQLPQTTLTANATFQVTVGAASSNSITVQVQPTAPAVFSFLWPSGGQVFQYYQAAVFHAGTGVPTDALHPAAPLEILESYGSGLGVTNPQVAAGEPSPFSPLAWAAQIPPVVIDVPAKVTFAGLVPGLVGIYQVNVQVPAGLAPGQHVFHWSASDTRGASIFTK